jgi:hypothetical protein
MMRPVICFASLCIGCTPNAASLATPAQHSVVSSRGSQIEQANRDHYRYKNWYDDAQRVNDTVAAELISRQQAGPIVPTERTHGEPEPEHAPFRHAPAVVVPTLHL